jgi:hypothetical protein
MPNVRTRKNGDVDGAFFNIPVEDKKWKADELVCEVLRRGGKIVLVSIKNWVTWIRFSLNKFWKLVTELQHADLEHKAKWLLIIPKLVAPKRVRRLLTTHRIEVVETGEQITLDETQSKTAQAKWLDTLNEKLKPQLHKFFGLLLYRLHNYTVHSNLRIICKLSYLQSLKSSVSKSFSETMKKRGFIRFIIHFSTTQGLYLFKFA